MSTSEVRKEVKLFSLAMERVLSLHDDERGDAWLDENPSFFVERLEDEMQELLKSVRDIDSHGVRHECIDLANFAMMLWWILSTDAQERS